MRIIINLSSIFKGGAEQVAVSFVNECRKFKNHTYAVVFCDNIADQLEKDEFPENFDFHILPERTGKSLRRYFKTKRFLDDLEKEFNPDVVITTGGHGYWKPKAPILGGFNIPHYIYPESPYFNGMGIKQQMYWNIMQKIHMYFYRRLNAIIVQTDDVNQRLKRLVGEKRKIYTVSNTVNGHYLEPKKQTNKLPKKQKNQRYLLTLSSYYPHKNLEIIRKVIQELKNSGKNEFIFVLTLPEDKYTRAFSDFKTDRIINIGPIPIAECPSLYQECDFMFLPTLLECFSASYAEAMLMKKPILTSNLGFAHTVCKDAAVYFDPIDPKDIANKIIALDNDANMQKQLVQNGIKQVRSINSANERAERFLEIAEGIIN
jgi:glycosyltransferase involved in cell wall biosynthesis